MTYLLRLVACLFLCVSLNSFGALHIRDLDGDWSNGHEGVYDDVLDITWLADANYAQTSGYDDDGFMIWNEANDWAAGLTLSGYTDWRLGNTVDIGNDGCNFSNSGTDCGYNVDTSTGEMASLFYDTLGNLAFYDTAGQSPQPGWGLANTGPFSNLEPNGYWSATNYGDSQNAWFFGFGFGDQQYNGQALAFYALPVHDGDIGASPVPLPAGIYLVLSGLVGLGLMRGRNG
jgi:hypothetical protein